MNPKQTRVSVVCDGLRDEIRLGTLQPGQQIDLAQVRARYGVSLTVVREAVTRLASERLVKSVPQQGFSVWPLSADGLNDITRVRVQIESLTVHDSVTMGDLNWESELVSAHHRLAAMQARAEEGVPSLDAMRAHDAFHDALSSACTSPLLKEIRQQLFRNSELYRYWSALPAVPKRTRERVAGEHQRLLDAALAHDADLAVELMVTHIQHATDALLARAKAAGADRDGAGRS
ncbi:GntR family transcriptional regulator [Actinomadura roseirufa]|uniref:GntR family transcriptional regulator n=1 Tax=Actinomadura roseirufa TaxID=2094049 RepID=UPI0013F14F55|nr:GntR family transcriptional regulator [Actinomadura roseirufa]